MRSIPGGGPISGLTKTSAGVVVDRLQHSLADCPLGFVFACCAGLPVDGGTLLLAICVALVGNSSRATIVCSSLL